MWVMHILPQDWFGHHYCGNSHWQLSVDCRLQSQEWTLQNQMREVWTISELGTAHFIIGIAVSWDRTMCTAVLSQTTLINKIVKQFGQKDASAPLDPGSKLCCANQQSMSSDDLLWLARLPYWSLVSCLLYLSIFPCPDISYVVQQLSQYLDFYSFQHWTAAIRVVPYLKGTRDLNLYLGVTLLLSSRLLATQIGLTASILLVVMCVPSAPALSLGPHINRMLSLLLPVNQNMLWHSKPLRNVFGYALYSTHLMINNCLQQ